MRVHVDLGGVCWGAMWLTALVLPPTALAAEPVGAARCGTCHLPEYEDWRSTAHARSLSSLSDAQQKDPTCRTCHTLAPTSDDPSLAGVQCESCHGVGTYYAPDHVMRDPRLSRLLGLEAITASTCRPCHDGVDARLRPIDYRTLIEAVSHRQKQPAPSAPGLNRPNARPKTIRSAH